MEIQKNELQKAIEIVKPGLATKEQIEQTTSFVFIEGRVLTYNDEVSISHPVKGIDITGAIHADELHSLLNKMNENEIKVKIKENEIQLKAKKAKAWFTLQQEVKIPLEEIGEKSEWKKLPGEFNRLMKFAMSACSTDLSEPTLTCVNVRKDGIIQSSDNYKMVQCTLPKKMPLNTFLIPAESVNKVIRINPTEVASGDGWVHFKNEEDTIISCRIFEEEFPDISKHLETEGIEITFPEKVKEIIDRASIFVKSDSILKERIDVSIGGNKMKIEGKSETGGYEEEATVNYDDDPLSFTIASYLLKDILDESYECTIGENKICFEGSDWKYISVLQMI